MRATARADPVDHRPPSPAAPSPEAVIGASVDLGSNSVHLLVASVAGHELTPLLDESVFLGLGSDVANRGLLGRAARGELCSVLARYAAQAAELGAEAVTFIGTEPIRRAADAAVIVHEVTTATHVPMYVLSHEEEAYLTIIGVTEGQPVTHETLVVDIGGGSSEFCLVDPVSSPRAAGLRLGSARLTDRYVNHDPPRSDEIEAMFSAALEAVRGAPSGQPAEIVAVGGTASNLLKVVPLAPDGVVTAAQIAEALRLFESITAGQAIERYALNPVRARILAAGAVILAAILERYAVPEVRVSNAGIREGTILAVAHAGPAWRDHLVDLAHGWRV
jgi:exopolyphosphatase / guanosine-5'-triphosphate,3'-diphosphate pyrophosphatase